MNKVNPTMEQILALRKQEYSFGQIAKMFGRHKSTIHERWKIYQTSIRKRRLLMLEIENNKSRGTIPLDMLSQN